jgi:hypothetical protein
MEHVFKPNKKNVGIRLLFGVITLLTFNFFCYIYKANIIFKIFCSILVNPLCIYAMIPIIKMLISNIGLIVSSNGIYDNTHGYGLIPWNKIIKINRAKWASINVIKLQLKPSYIESLPVIRKFLINYGIKKGMKPILNIGFLKDDPEYIYSIIFKVFSENQSSE